MDQILKKKRASPVIKVQKDLLVEFMAKHPNLRSGRFTTDFTFKKAKQLWIEISETLNAIPSGSTKDWHQWRKTWQDCKKNAKSRRTQLNFYANQTGGGPPAPDVLKSEDSQVLDLLSNTEINGISVPESTIDFGFTDDESKSSMPSSNQENVTFQTISTEVDVHVVELTGNESEKKNLEDHTYNMTHPTPSSSKMVKTPLKLNKTRRLENSLKISQGLLKSVSRRDEILENYYAMKMNYLEHKKKYDLQHLVLLANQNNISKKILDTLTLIYDQNSPQPNFNNARPKRAARPTSLKDASLKVKLRRMF